MGTSLLSPSKRVEGPTLRHFKQEVNAQHFSGSGCKQRAKCFGALHSLWIVHPVRWIHSSPQRKSHDVEGISAIGDLLKSNNSKTFAVSQRRIRRIGEGCRSVLPCADRLEISLPGEKQKSLQVRMSYRRNGSPSGSDKVSVFSVFFFSNLVELIL